jgi:hypothetical protein
MKVVRIILTTLIVVFLCGFQGTPGSSSGGSLTGSQFQIPSFTGTNTASGNSTLLTDSSHDFLITTGNLQIDTAIGTNTSGFSLSSRDPNGDLSFGVPLFRSTTATKVTALDVGPNGAPGDTGYGQAWEDICNADLLNFAGNGSCLHLGARSGSTGNVDIGENQYGTGTTGVVNIVDGPGNGSSATVVASFGTTQGVGIGTVMFFNTVYSAAGTAVPAASAHNHARLCVSDSTLCTSGTTYTSGGSTACELWSNGTNWIESGGGC